MMIRIIMTGYKGFAECTFCKSRVFGFNFTMQKSPFPHELLQEMKFAFLKHLLTHTVCMERHIFSKSPALRAGEGLRRMTGGTLDGWAAGIDTCKDTHIHRLHTISTVGLLKGIW